VLFWVITQIRLRGCPETSVGNYRYSLLNNPEQRSSLLLRGGSVKSRTMTLEIKINPTKMVSATAMPISSAWNSTVKELGNVCLQNKQALNGNVVTVLNLQPYLAYSLVVVEK